MGMILEATLVHPNSNNSILLNCLKKQPVTIPVKKGRLYLDLGGNLCAMVWRCL